jgi:DNA-binding transcriptional ArsR family regulator
MDFASFFLKKMQTGLIKVYICCRIKYTNMKSHAVINIEKLRFASGAIRVVGHKDRMKIVDLLMEQGELNVTQIYEQLKMKQAEISGQLILLKNYGILKKVRRGKCSMYSANKDLITKIAKISEDLYSK